MRIALTGNPNSGKTTMYNALTGRSIMTIMTDRRIANSLFVFIFSVFFLTN